MLIGLTGTKGSGKDLAASFLVEEGYTRRAFADKMKEAVANLFGITIADVEANKFSGAYLDMHLGEGQYPAYTYTWREFLQRFGTEMGRNTFGRDFWVDLALPIPLVGELEESYVVFSDVRFPNEAVRIKLLGGYVIEILRPGHEPDGHASEKPLPRDLVDATIRNDSTVDVFRQRVLALVHGLDVGVSSEC